MTVQRFHDETIDQYSYLISEEGEAIAIDPNRRIRPYLEYLKENNLRLVAIVMTHRPGAFASGWAELRRVTGADMVSQHTTRFHGEGKYVEAGRSTMIPFGTGSHLQTQLTPGYSADSISVLAITRDHATEAIFTGNTLLQDGAGFPLPRPEDKNPLHDKRTYAKETYESIYGTIRGFDQKATVYAGFGEDAHFSKMGSASHGRFNLTEAQAESPVFDKKIKNADQFADWLLENYPFVPAYVSGCLEDNPGGYPDWSVAMAKFGGLMSAERRQELELSEPVASTVGGAVILTPRDAAAPAEGTAPANPPNALPLGEETLLIDTRRAADFKAGHARNAINIQCEGQFALWLGAIVRPGEDFHVLVDTEENAYRVGQSVAKIGYDRQLSGATRYLDSLAAVMEPALDLEDFRAHHVGKYTIVDVRPPAPAMEDTRFYGAINVPVWTIRDRYREIPRDRPIVVHCGGGYHSAIGASLLRMLLDDDSTMVYDLGDDIKKFKADR